MVIFLFDIFLFDCEGEVSKVCFKGWFGSGDVFGCIILCGLCWVEGEYGLFWFWFGVIFDIKLFGIFLGLVEDVWCDVLWVFG